MRRTVLLAAALAVSVAAQDSRPESRPPSADEVRSAIAHATELLVKFQENYVEAAAPRTRFKNDEERKAAEKKKKAAEALKSKEAGAPKEWPYEGVYRLQGLISPGYRVGGTAIVCWALLEAPGFDQDSPRRAAFDRGVAFVLDSLEKEPLLESGFLETYDVRGWAHAYGLRMLLRGLERGAFDAKVAKRAAAMCRSLVKTLVETEIPKCGGWNYSRSGPNQSCPPSPFMTAPTLQILFQARNQGYQVPPEVVERGLKTLEDARLDTGSFQYSTNERKTGKGIEEIPGACARMAVCETTLVLAGRGSIDRIRTAVDAFFREWEWLEKRRKGPGTHPPPYGIAPYFFHYGHTYAAQAIEQLPEAERPPLREKLRALYFRTREPDGGWNDRHFPRSEGYGTAMAILGLMMPELPPPATWASKTGAPTTKPSK
jgi:hypothetical protein